MATLSHARIAGLLLPYFADPAPLLLDQLSTYLDLLVRWNAKTNLTSIRDPEQMVRVHFGESLVASAVLPASGTLLDLGSGAGFPGLPLQLACPLRAVTLAESQSKKASFLRETIRTLGLGTEVWGARIETMDPLRTFDVVTLRAVDDPKLALQLAQGRMAATGVVAHWTMAHEVQKQAISIPGTEKVIEMLRLQDVPRGT